MEDRTPLTMENRFDVNIEQPSVYRYIDIFLMHCMFLFIYCSIIKDYVSVRY